MDNNLLLSSNSALLIRKLRKKKLTLKSNLIEKTSLDRTKFHNYKELDKSFNFKSNDTTKNIFPSLSSIKSKYYTKVNSRNSSPNDDFNNERDSKSTVKTKFYNRQKITLKLPEKVRNNMIKREILSELNNKLSMEGIDIKLYLANEVRITSDILSLIKNDEISLLGNYLFLELPFDQRIYNLENIIYELQSNNINIILVHPERYAYLTKDDYQKLLDSDVIFQANYESIIGKYGSGAKKRVKYLLSNKMITLLATDVHRPTTMMFSQWDKIERKIKKFVGTEEYKNLTYNNINNILNSIRS